MNFHKTIGYLAALLLMVGFGVPDSFAQQTLVLNLEPAAIVDNAGSATVAVTVTVIPAVATTVATDFEVTVSLPSHESYEGRPSITITVSVNGSVGDKSGDLTIDVKPDADTEDEIITVTASASGFTDATADLTIVDGGALDLTDSATDGAGYRVVIAKPAAGAWAKAGKNQVVVQVLRRHGLASHFGAYETIKVALRNRQADDKEDVPDDDLYALEVLDVDGTLSNLSLESAKTDSLNPLFITASGLGTVGIYGNNNVARDLVDETTNIVAYKKRSRSGKYDTLEFRFNIPPFDGALNMSRVYALVTFGVANVVADYPTIASRDTDTSIYPGADEDKVGDGKLIQIDRDPPAATVISTLTATITGNDLAGAGIGDEIEIEADLDGVFRDNSVVFQIIVPALEEVPDPDPDNVGMTVITVKANGALVGYSESFDFWAVVNSGGKLSDKFKVTTSQFKRKYTANDPNDPRKYHKNDTFEADNLMVRVWAQVKDLAGNATSQTEVSADFLLDSKPPKVTIEYPKPSAADSMRFTAGINQDYEFLGEGATNDEPLKPLNYTVNEPISEAYVVIDGSHANLSDTLDIGTDDGEIDLTKGSYDLRMYVLPNGKMETKKPHKEGPYNKGTKTVKLTVAAYDMSGNLGKATPTGGDPIFDNKAAKITKLFPNNTDLADYDQKIGGPEGTQHPVFRLNEKVDSINVRYEGGGTILSVVGSDADNNTVNNNIRIKFLGDDALQQGEIYDMQVYVRDLAGHVTLSDADGDEDGAQPEEGFTFDNDLSNPQAGDFKISTHVRGIGDVDGTQEATFVAMDSVVANQGMRLDIVALDKALSESSGEDRVAITYNKAGVQVVVMDSDGNPVPKAKFWGGASGTGTTTLDDLGWSGGKRSIFLSSTLAGSYTIAVKDMNDDGTLNFMKTTDIVVDAADFAKFEITAWEEGVPATQVWGDFDLQVVPTDRYGNASLKTFNNFTGTGKVAPVADQDSLDILDTRVGKNKPAPVNASNTTKKYSNVDVSFAASLIEDLPFSWPITESGDTFSVTTAENKTRGTAKVRAIVNNSFLLVSDLRSRNKSGDASFTIGQPLSITITLWGPNGEDWTDESDITLPAGGAEVKFRAEGFGEGDMVTFTVDGEAQDAVEADASGYAGQPVTLSGSGTVTVKAASGSNSAEEVSYVYAEQEGVREFVDANGGRVYLVSLMDNTVDENDISAFVAAYLSSVGDAAYNAQADADGSGTVDDDDLALIVTSWLKTAVNGPATKPLVLPGVNENAEFSLSLGSERVVAGELVAVDVSLANVAALMGYGFKLNYETDKFEFVSFASADEDLLKSTGGETLSHHVVTDGQIAVVTGIYNGTAVSGGGDIVRFVFRVLREFEDNARFEIADGLVFDPSQLQNPAVVAGVLELQSTPREFALHQNFPNPFNPDTTIKYDLAESADVTLQIYNVLGQVVRTLVASEAQNAGRYQIRWNGMDDRGVSVSSGIYFYQISAEGKFQNVRKLMLLK